MKKSGAKKNLLVEKSEATINLLVVGLLIFGNLEMKQGIPVMLIGFINLHTEWKRDS